MKYFPDSTHIVKYQDDDQLNVLMIEFIDSDDILPPDLLVEDLHKYCYSFLLQNESDPFSNCREIDILRICPYPPEFMENKLIKVEGDVVLDFNKLDIVNGSILQALLGSPDQSDLPKPLRMLDILFRAETGAEDRKQLLSEIEVNDISPETFDKFLELSKILYNLSFYRDPYSDI